MINASTIPIDVEEMRLWALDYREQHSPPLSWAKFAKECGIPEGTLQPFVKGNYNGDNEDKARSMFRFRQSVEARRERQLTIPTDPGHFETETSLRIRSLLSIAHMGRITVAATGPGTGKTMTAEDYAERAQPVWYACMSRSTRRLNAMMAAVLAALDIQIKYASGNIASRAVQARVKGRRGLLIIDEAQHCEWESLEEIRHWHDKTGVGICLMGNEELLSRIESGRHADAFGRLNSRIAMRHIQRLPLPADVEAFCEAWQLREPGIKTYLERIALTPGSGGLRECKMIVEAGCMLASADDRGLSLADLRDAQSTRATRWIDA